jgi:aldose 1-epimerase
MGPLREVVLGNEALEVTILPDLGARLHRVRAYGVDLLRTPGDHGAHAIDPFFWGAYVMAPWANRAPAGPQELAGRRIELQPNFVDGTVIHGLVHSAPWKTIEDGGFGIRGGGDGDAWPWAFETTLHASVEDRALVLDARLTNRSEAAMPAGIGLHPWFRRPLEVRLPAERVYETNTGSSTHAARAAGRYDLRSLATPADDLDGTWVAPAPSIATLAWPDVGLRATLEVEAPHVCVAIATPAALDAIAVEPQTHGPDGMRRLIGGEADALALLPPGETLRLAVHITVERVSLSR